MTDYVAGPPSLLRSINVRAVLQLFAGGQALTRAEVAAASGLSKPTVSAALTHLVEHGLLAEVGLVAGRKGPAAQLYSVAADAFLALGIDVGRQHLRVAAVDARGEIRARRTVPTPDTVRGIAERLAGLADELAEEIAGEAGADREVFLRTVVGLPGVVDPHGRTLRYAGGLPADGAGLVEALVATLGDDIVLENDINLSAIVEGRSGAAGEVDDFVLLGLSTGAGMGVVLGGRLHRGASGAAGEIGFIPGPGPAGAAPGEVVDDVLGSERIMEQAAAHGLPGLEPPAVFELARRGDPRALAVVDDTARTLAWVVATIVAVLDPQLVVLGGAVGGNGDLLVPAIERHLDGLTALSPTVVGSTLGSGAVLLGALAVAEDLARELAFATAAAAPAPAERL